MRRVWRLGKRRCETGVRSGDSGGPVGEFGDLAGWYDRTGAWRWALSHLARYRVYCCAQPRVGSADIGFAVGHGTWLSMRCCEIRQASASSSSSR